jgi:hypothetical protein
MYLLFEVGHKVYFEEVEFYFVVVLEDTFEEDFDIEKELEAYKYLNVEDMHLVEEV